MDTNLSLALPPPVALTIAGFDPSSGAGATADLQTFSAHGVFGISALTALTVQSTRGVRRVERVNGQLLRETLDCLEEDLPPVGIKIGMLGSEEQVDVVVEYVRSVRARRSVCVVLDPVLRSSSGAVLLDSGGMCCLRTSLLPLCDCVTPNQEELAALVDDAAPLSGLSSTGYHERTDGALEASARRLQEQVGGRELILTRGDAAEGPIDLHLLPGGGAVWLEGRRMQTTSTHGTGCAFSSALLSRRVLGDDLSAAALAAKRYVEGALRSAPHVGGGRGPMNLLWTRPLP